LQPGPLELSERVWWIASIAIFLVAAILRIYNLNLVPLHHDEGVNGNFLVTLVRDGRYHYDPANYHGPTLYYLTAIIPWTIRLLFGQSARETYGLNTVVIRLVPALFSLGTIVLIFLLRRKLGTVATLSAALFFAISPGSVYLARYYIHETLFVFFTLGIVVAAIRFYDDRNPVYLLLASASAAMLFATKETAMISAGVLILAFSSTQIYLRLLGNRTAKSENSESSFFEQMGGATFLTIFVVIAIIVFLVVNLVFYSSFFTNYPKGVYDALKTFEIWTKTGQAAHVHPPKRISYG